MPILFNGFADSEGLNKAGGFVTISRELFRPAQLATAILSGCGHEQKD